MSDRYFEVLRDSSVSSNYIPSGRQLPRTPPLSSVKKHLDFCTEDSNDDFEQLQQNMERADGADQDDNNQDTMFDFNTNGTKTEPDDPNSMLKGMKGYQLTQADLEFIENMKTEKLIKKLQGDLEEVLELIEKEMMPLELACASRDKAQAELKTLPSCEDLTEWIKVVLKMTSPMTKLTDLDAPSLLAMVTSESVERATEEKRIELTQMKKTLANKRKKDAKERGQLEKQFAAEQLKIQGLMSHLSDLKSELVQQEEACKGLEMQMSTRDAPEFKAEEVETSEEVQDTNRPASRRGKGRTKAVKSAEKLQDTTNQSKSTRSKLAGGQSSVKDDLSNKNASETLKAKQKSGAEKLTKSVKKARGPQKKVEEQESVRAARGRRKSPGAAPAAASQPKTRMKLEEAPSMSQQAAPSRGRKQAAAAAGDAGEEAQNTFLRRSKRIASRR